MTEQGKTLERVFEGHKMSVVMAMDKDGHEQPAMVISEIAQLLDYDRNALTQIIGRKETIFAHQGVGISLTPGGQQRVKVLFAPGVIGLLCNLEPQQVEDPDRQAMIVRFQNWAYETLAAILKGEYTGGGIYGQIIEWYKKGQLISRDEAWKEQADLRWKVKWLESEQAAARQWDAQEKIGEWVHFKADEPITSRNAAVLTGKSLSTIRRWCKDKKLESLLYKDRWLIEAKSLAPYFRDDLQFRVWMPSTKMSPLFGELQPHTEEVVLEQ